MGSKKIIVVGSSNMDMVVRTDHIPAPGETVLSGSFFMNAGGKGANQAVAVARMGGDILFISKLGNDVFGKQFFQLLKDEGINTSFILFDNDRPSGVALITVDNAGENSIVVASGANAYLQIADIRYAQAEIENAGIILLQLETPIETVQFVTDYAFSKGIKVILNPAPARPLPVSLLSKLDILTPNMTEATLLSGIEVTDLNSAIKAAGIIHAKGVKNVVITLGSMGAIIYQAGKCDVVPANKVTAIDTTGAGDVFNGALAVALAEDNDLKTAVEFACEAAAISVTRLGAQAAIPYRHEIIVKQLNLADPKMK